MKTNRILFIALAVSITACSSDENKTNEANQMVINLGASIGQSGSTRAVTNDTEMQDAAFVSGESVDIFLYEDYVSPTTARTTTYGTNGKLTCTTGSAGALTLPSTQHWPTNSTSGIKAFGYYPSGVVSNAESTTLVTFAVQTDQSNQATTPYSAYKASDLMYGMANSGNHIARSASVVDVVFTHLLSKVNVELTAGSGLTADDLNGATIKLKQLKTNTQLNPSTGALSVPASPTTSDIKVLEVEATGAGSPATVQATDLKGSAVVIPQDITADGNNVYIEVTLSAAKGGGVLNYKPNIAGTQKITLAGHTEYTYQVTVNLSGLTVKTSVNDWTAGTTVTDATAEM